MYFDLIHSPQLIPESPQLPYPPNLVFSLKKKKIILSGMRLVPEHGQPIRSHPQKPSVS